MIPILWEEDSILNVVYKEAYEMLSKLFCMILAVQGEAENGNKSQNVLQYNSAVPTD